ncbi:hypothetical protein [Actinocrinis sp.]|uniref:hypothetical protein n=1 Tax=Actinocrinis sp. TaxID=1920516 RepID=UPI002DDD849A|nr:hypothetical protein [Actinocrinis sp.]
MASAGGPSPWNVSATPFAIEASCPDGLDELVAVPAVTDGEGPRDVAEVLDRVTGDAEVPVPGDEQPSVNAAAAQTNHAVRNVSLRDHRSDR